MQLEPVETAQRGKDFAFIKAATSCGGTDRIGRFDDEQWFVAIDDVNRLELTFAWGLRQ